MGTRRPHLVSVGAKPLLLKRGSDALKLFQAVVVGVLEGKRLKLCIWGTVQIRWVAQQIRQRALVCGLEGKHLTNCGEWRTMHPHEHVLALSKLTCLQAHPSSLPDNCPPACRTPAGSQCASSPIPPQTQPWLHPSIHPPWARQSGQAHSPAGRASSGGARQKVCQPLGQRAHGTSRSAACPPPHFSQEAGGGRADAAATAAASAALACGSEQQHSKVKAQNRGRKPTSRRCRGAGVPLASSCIHGPMLSGGSSAAVQQHTHTHTPQ